MTNMNQKKFLEELTSLLEAKSPVSGTETLMGLSGWDSLAVTGFIAMADKNYNRLIKPEDIENCKTVDDLYTLISTGES